jgi:ribosomal protein S18 acetylase RimI-like enzyme
MGENDKETAEAGAGPTSMGFLHLIRIATEYDLEAVAQIHVASWQDAYKGVVPYALLASRTTAGSLSGWRSTFSSYPTNITVATSPDGEIQGFCCAGAVDDEVKNSPFEFQIYGLHVWPNLRRLGIGAALLRNALARAKLEGFNSGIVWTLRDLRLSRSFYERQGGEVVSSGTWSIGQIALPEVAYGWTTLRQLSGVDRIRA